MRNIDDNLETSSNKRVSIDFNPVGHLLLANNQTADQLREDLTLQKALGCSIEPIEPDQIKARWPWLNTHDIAFATHGLENEGWFNPAMLLQALKLKAHELGVNYVTAELIDIRRADFISTNISMGAYPERQLFNTQPIRYAQLRALGGQEHEMTFATMVNAAGPWAKEIALMAGIGSSEIPLSLPVEKVLVHAFLLRPAFDVGYDVTYCPGLDAPFLVDFDGINVQRVGLSGDFIVYRSASPADVVDSSTCEDDLIWLQNCPQEFVNEFYTSTLQQAIVNRIPALKDSKVCNAWSTFDDLNTFDRTPVVGYHPLQLQMLFACGMSGYGAQHCLGVGRAISELVTYRDYRTIDLSSFGFARFYMRETVSDQSNVASSHLLAESFE
ncbi:FAD-dependent oxidoreductase domain-containing protein 1 [Cichlidogyrus casuarinus]|uniref:FAD-dependent oxidoreductase domain-containing protein 1 n=1 Tax=Cichlidogyrus casuarinus TaxID=1844966 RepID=A0ABD2Q957_9PLAT